MKIVSKNIGFGITGSFCTVVEILDILKMLKAEGANIFPVMSDQVYHNDSRFHNRDQFLAEVEEITGRKVISTIAGAETMGPDTPLDVMIIAPATGTSLAKLANGISDTPVLMATKATLRNGRPVLLAMFSNDAMGANGVNVARLFNTKNIYFVPFGQDNPIKKPTSLTADMSLLKDGLLAALEGKQLQPALIMH